ncbi:MAG: WHG domain-containing protein [Desulfobacterales bacterium]|nr:WHG domain-containing protein [Desulfobacterales bacterium]
MAPAFIRPLPSHLRGLVTAGTRLDTDLPREVLRAGLTLWGMIHGLVSVEISGRFTPLLEDPGAMFEAQLVIGLRLLGLEKEKTGDTRQ